MAAILKLTITADIKGYCPIGHLQTSVISDVGLIGHPSSMSGAEKRKKHARTPSQLKTQKFEKMAAF